MSEELNTRGYTLEVYQDPEDGSWVAEVPDLPGCVAAGMSPAETLSQVDDAITAWIFAAEADGRPVPTPRSVDEEYSGRFVVRVPTGLHRRLVTEARRQGTSLNTFCVTALSEAVGSASARAWIQAAASEPSAYIPAATQILFISRGEAKFLAESHGRYRTSATGSSGSGPIVIEAKGRSLAVAG